MKQRALGKQGLVVPAIGLGTMGMSGVAGSPEMYGKPDEAEGIATIHRALELGVNFFDTAEVYGPYANEALLDRALAGRRSQAIIATKFGFKFADGRIAGQDSRPENVRAALEGCLKRLGTDHIDLWYQHRLDRSVPIEDTVGVMAEQVKAGKVRYLGLSEVGIDTLRRAHRVHPISALQSEYSLWERNLEADIIPTLRELKIGLVPFSPLGRGFLTDAAKPATDYSEGDFRRESDPRLQGTNFDANLRATVFFRELAKNKGITPAQLALAWILHKGDGIVPIPGTKRRKYLEENAGALDVKLSPAQVAALDAVFPPDAAAGERYPPNMMAALNR